MNCLLLMSQNMSYEIGVDCCNQNLTLTGTDTTHLDIFSGSKLRNSLPSHLKNTDDIHDFRRELYEWCLSDQAIKIIGQLDW